MDMYGHSGKMGRSESGILCPGVPTAARDGVSSYPGSSATPESRDTAVLFGPGGAPSAETTNGVACPDALAATLTTGVPPATRNAAHYTDRLTAQLSSVAAAPTPRNGAAYLSAVLMPQLSSGVAAKTPRIAVAYPDVLDDHVSSTLLPATWNSVACPSSGAPEAAVYGVAFPAVATASENAVGHAIDMHDGGYDELSGTALPFAAQADYGTDRDVLLDAAVAQVEGPGAVAEGARGGLGRLGLAAAALAVAGLTAGGTAMPATALALFAMLVAGVTLVTARVSRLA